MKSTYFVLLTIFHYSCLEAQSISATKIYEYLVLQNTSSISKDIESKGFVYKTSAKAPNGNFSYYVKDSSYGHEACSLMSNDELFGIIYKPDRKYFESYKEKMLTSDFNYSYSVGKDKYYENGKLRIGINGEDGILSFFSDLN